MPYIDEWGLKGRSKFGSTRYGAARIGTTVKIGKMCPIDAVNLAYVSSPPTTPLDNVEVTSIINNHSLNTSIGFSSTLSNLASSFTDNLIITDKTHTDNVGNSYPLWYKYVSRYFVYDTTSYSISGAEDLAYVDQDGGGRLPSGYYYHIERELTDTPYVYRLVVYANFKGDYDVIYKLHYNRCNSVGALIGKLGYEETINSAPTFKQKKTYPETSESQVYYAEPMGAGFAIYVDSTSYPTSSRSNVYVRAESGKQIYLDIPDVFSLKDNWYIRIHRGCLTNGSRKLVEYYGQPFTDYIPIMRVRKEKATIVGENTIRLSHTPIVVEPSFLIDVYVNDSCITRDTGRDPLSYVDDIYSPLKVKDIIGSRGIIELDGVYLTEEDEVFVNYYYCEYYLKYRGYEDKAGAFVHLDLNLNAGHYFTDIFFVFSDYVVSPMIDSSGTEPIGGLQRRTSDLIDRTIHLYWRPDGKVFHVILPKNNPAVYDPTLHKDFMVGLHNFFPYIDDRYTVTGTGSGDTIYLGTITLNSDLAKAILVDTRSEGGGLKSGVELEDDSELWWDKTYWDGIPFQINGAILIDANTQSFNKEYIQSVAKLFKAQGTTVILTNRSGTTEVSNNTPYEV